MVSIVGLRWGRESIEGIEGSIERIEGSIERIEGSIERIEKVC
ncbi:MAG TPA: hypothetical protein PLQ49_08185 [Methanothrix sp.]|nr:hypothetical protein [Methanothrix sp.]HRW83461.1 hypothetical protein [Methanothrix sp.]